ncbi:C-type lectin 37Db [Drosophila virilis]|uniref:C-type lectin domain-containing protein n=1 Tax=Drosophila virilis TaxID=7244 RepID=B4LRB5_DROVI|nr:C-type lectin domain family 4 member E [Drosophila virilis]EDW64585.1 uncharacterized protein Dvir_GJ21703 [Drosophila virilis]
MFRITVAALILFKMLTALSMAWARIADMTTSRLGIPAGYHVEPLFRKFATGYYYIPDAAYVTWFTALHDCHSIGGHLIGLAKLETLHEMGFHVRNATHTKNYWLDLTDLAQNGDYVSMSSGKKPNYVHWCDDAQPNQPNISSNCVNVENTNASRPCMKSVPCHFFRSYICQAHTPSTVSIVVF